MKILYITLLNSNEKNGGFVYRKAIGAALANIAGENNFDVVTSKLDDSAWNGNIVYQMEHYDSSIDKLKNIIHGNITQIGQKDERVIVELINYNKYDIVALGCSETGNLIRVIKRKTKAYTITLYNDIIADAVKRKWEVERKLTYLPIAYNERHAEKMDIMYSDLKIALNARDSLLMNEYWKTQADAMIPICLEDTFDSNKCFHGASSEQILKLLFVGSYGWSVNIEGISWFCKHVMSKLPTEQVRLNIAGFGMENIKSTLLDLGLTNIDVVGTVDDLSAEYAKADVVVAPILSGTGMKTKTAEALMHGKCILASPEALEGFVGLEDALCVDQNQYYDNIMSYVKQKPNRFIQSHRELFEEYYSVPAMEKKLREIIYNGCTVWYG